MNISPKELRTDRIAAGLTREQLARRIGVPTDRVTDWETGDVPIDCSDELRTTLHTTQPSNAAGRATMQLRQ